MSTYFCDIFQNICRRLRTSYLGKNQKVRLANCSQGVFFIIMMLTIQRKLLV